MIEFTGKIVLVTGSSRGIGAGMSRAFAKHGARCVINYVADPNGKNQADAETVAREINSPLTIECDVANHARVGQTKVAAREFARQKITVNAIAPGYVDTEMIRGMPEDVAQKAKEQIPLGRFGTVDDIANAAMFLCSPMADYITGQTIHVNGGFYM